MRTLSRVGVGGRGMLRIPQFVHRTYRRSRHIDVSFQILFVYENGGVHHRNFAASLVFFDETGSFQRMYHSAYIYVCAPWLTRYYLELGQKGSNIIWPTSAYGMEGAEEKNCERFPPKWGSAISLQRLGIFCDRIVNRKS